MTEVASAIALKVRTRQLEEEHRSRIIQAFDFLIADTFGVLPVEREHFRNATVFIGRPAVNLRSGGALHLAIATHRHATVLTLDRGMAESGDILGIRTELI
ncbi:type II toxin-antitoxin system VapC family toxin [Rhizobium mongolense]|uniref:type II toxin-antitoxin system VapC family toxin n=1 Tax=Rhizobium TaxID=379 RepID=UPI0024B0A972|nr:type II toxin-antitoxin system VapC family toxin [Rhizobium sp. CC1099]WFU91623.1 type II toxin-antitoxin system VapC family toxin [Rhizobium sp. CC1099]